MADTRSQNRTAGRGLAGRLMRPEAISGQTTRRRAVKEEERSPLPITASVRSGPGTFGGEIPGHHGAPGKKGSPMSAVAATRPGHFGIRRCCSTTAGSEHVRSAAAHRRRQDRESRSAGAAPWPPPPRSSIGAAPAGDLGTFLSANRTHVESSDNVHSLISTTLTACRCISLRGLHCE